ncbi:MAG: hypothetical protein R3F65_03695 [bacterium]|nr:hypothetical protein [Myxococcales bacterium]MCB9551343.1 hypothetical protein [Myxococcales bacterium]
MPKVLTAAGKILCGHGTQAMVAQPNLSPKVTVMNQAVVLAAAPFTVSGCPNMPSAAAPSNIPCTAITFPSASDKTMKVTSMGQPLLLQTASGGMATCAPPAPPSLVPVQQKVEAM